MRVGLLTVGLISGVYCIFESITISMNAEMMTLKRMLLNVFTKLFLYADLFGQFAMRQTKLCLAIRLSHQVLFHHSKRPNIAHDVYR